MKKLTTIMIVALTLVALMMALAACGGDAPATNGEQEVTTLPAEIDPVEPDGEQEATTLPAEVDPIETEEASMPFTITEGILTMATSADFPPYEFWYGGEIVGIDPAIARAIAEMLGLELQIADMEFASVLVSVETGMFDIAMAGLTVTEERLEQVSFSISYATGIQAIIVPEGSPITHRDDLYAEGASTRIGVQLSTTGDLYATWFLEDEGLATIERFVTGADAIMALNAGRVDTVIIDKQPALAFVAVNPGLVVLDSEFENEDYAIALNRNNTALLEAINEALATLIADGTVQEIIDRYIY